MELSKKHKTFSQFFAEFLKCNINFKYFEKKDNLHRFCASDITASENVVRWMSKKYRFRESFDKHRGQPAEALLKSASAHFYPIDWSLKSHLGWKKSLLFICQILGLLFNTLAADEKYPLLKRDNLTVLIQMQLSQKQKTFSLFLAAIWKSRWNFEHLEKKHSLIDFVILKLRTLKT